MKKLLFIYNMHSGKGTIRNHLASVVDEFNKNGYEVTVYSTQYRGHATELVKQFGEAYPLVVCSGGDGTLSEVVDGLMSLDEAIRPKVGYIPAGSTNDYASTLGLPSQMRRCAQMIAAGNFRKVDVGHFFDDYFVYVAAFGAFTEVSYNTPQEEKNKLGHSAYIVQGIRQLPNIRPYRMKVSWGEETIEKEFVYGMVYNAKSVGGFRNLSGQEVELDDGELDVMLIQTPDNAVEWPILLADLMTKNPSSKFITSIRTREIVFESDEEVDWVLDGEFGGAHNRVCIDTCRQAISIAVQKEERENKGERLQKEEQLTQPEQTV